MEIAGFTIKNRREYANGNIECDLYYRAEFFAHITADSEFYDVGLDFRTGKNIAAAAGQELLRLYPYGVDQSFKYNNVGMIGVSSQAAYAGEYGNIIFLIEQLVRLDTLETLYKSANDGEVIVVYNTPGRGLKEAAISRDKMATFQYDVLIHNGIITFVGQSKEDFELR